MTHDTISDFITQIKNGSSSKKESVLIPYSNLKFAIAQKLSDKGYVKPPVKKGKKVAKFVEVGLVYSVDGDPRISDVKRLSKPSKRLYIGASEIRPIKQGYGSLILSTPNGIMSDDEARKAKVGGEILFKIW